MSPDQRDASSVYGQATFDAYARDYEEALQRGVGLSGEDSAFFAQRRVEWLQGRLDELRKQPRDVLDFGCGTGSTTPFLRALRGAERVVGVDPSSNLLDVARREHGSTAVRFGLPGELAKDSVDLAYCNGVFHHIPVGERGRAMAQVWQALRPGGLFALWENNPWNPATRLVMKRIPFDRDAVTLRPADTRRLLAAGGFEVVRTDFLFVFPRLFSVLRVLEPAMSRLPVGAQYLVLAAKPNVR
jgi:SAM-dependent methyltransferase